jgi:hypothetical protein
MDKAVLNSMPDTERMLVAETDRDAMAGLDEDELLELHQRIRRARTKYVKNYRRAASAAVSARGGRGRSYPQNRRDRDRAEVFEEALARVSRRLGVVASESAKALKAERLEAARSDGAGPARSTATAGTAPATGRARTARKTTGGVKKDASSRSQGARRQAKRDAR